MDVDIAVDWNESRRARDEFLDREQEAVAQAGQLIRRAMFAGHRVFILGSDTLAPLATYASRIFLGGGVTGQSRRLPLGALQDKGEIPALLAPEDVLIWMTLSAKNDPPVNALAQARERGVRVIGLSGQPAELLTSLCDARIVVPSRHQVVVAEVLQSVLHSLFKIACESEDPTGGRPSRSRPAPPPTPSLGRGSRPTPRLEDVPAPAPAPPPPTMGFWGPDAARAADALSGVEEAPLSMDFDGALSGTRRSRGLDPGPHPGVRPPDEPSRRERSDRTRRERGRDGKSEGKVKPVKPVKFRCGSCQSVITVDSKFVGKKGQCPYCLAEFIIPEKKSGRSSGKTRATKVVRAELDDSEGGERRRATRFEVVDARILFKMNGEWIKQAERVADVSISGVGVRLTHMKPEQFESGVELAMALDFPAFSEPLRVNGCLRRVEEEAWGIRLGFEFTAFKPDAKKKLRRLHENIALRGIRRR